MAQIKQIFKPTGNLYSLWKTSGTKIIRRKEMGDMEMLMDIKKWIKNVYLKKTTSLKTKHNIWTGMTVEVKQNVSGFTKKAQTVRNDTKTESTGKWMNIWEI